MMSLEEHHIPHESSLASEAFYRCRPGSEAFTSFLETKKILYQYKISGWLGAITPAAADKTGMNAAGGRRPISDVS